MSATFGRSVSTSCTRFADLKFRDLDSAVSGADWQMAQDTKQQVEADRTKLAGKLSEALGYIAKLDKPGELGKEIADNAESLNGSGFLTMDYDPNYPERAKELRLTGSDAVTLVAMKLDPSGNASLRRIDMFFDKSVASSDGQAIVTLANQLFHVRRALQGRFVLGDSKAESRGAYEESIPFCQLLAARLNNLARSEPAKAAEYRRVAKEIIDALGKDIEDLRKLRQ